MGRIMVKKNPAFVPGVDANKTMDIVRELRASGLKQGIDFDFKYQQASFDFTVDDDLFRVKGATFYFRAAKWATFFRMKYGC